MSNIKEIECPNCRVNLISEDEPTVYLAVSGSEAFKINSKDKTLDFYERDIHDIGELHCCNCDYYVEDLFKDFILNY